MKGGLRQWFVRTVYADQNSSVSVRRALEKTLLRLRDNDVGLNVGAGFTRFGPRVFNVDLELSPSVGCRARAESLPFANGCFSIVISQETLEHVIDPPAAIREMWRVTKPGGTLYLQLPFVIGYHPGPTDYWRFSKEGIRTLAEKAGFTCEETGIAVGPATGFYRITVEFFALLVGGVCPCVYRVAKGVAALMLFPLKWLDSILVSVPEADRIAGGYYLIARK